MSKKRIRFLIGLVIFVTILVFLGWRGIINARNTVKATSAISNFKQISHALNNYYCDYGTLPPAFVTDKDGKPLYSWRVLLLPYVEGKERYEQYKLDEPWDSPHNRNLLNPVPCSYRSPWDDNSMSNTTPYVAMVGKDTLWRVKDPTDLRKYQSTASIPISLLFHPEGGVCWAEPKDVSPDELIKSMRKISSKSSWSRHPFFYNGVPYCGPRVEFKKLPLSSTNEEILNACKFDWEKKPEFDQSKHARLVKSVCDEADAIINKKREARESIKNSLGMDLVLIPAGEFIMGNSLDDDEELSYFPELTVKWLNLERPSHRVRITRPFYMGANVVTRGQFRRFVKDTGYKTDVEKDEESPGTIGVDVDNGLLYGFNEDAFWDNVSFKQDDRHPVVNVSWNDAVAFCKWLSRREGKTYRLPTEAEWEYACRAGTTTRYWFGNNAELLAKFANTAGPELRAKFPKAPFQGMRVTHISDGYVFTAPAGSFPPNPFGLYDMHGNVWQWCSDFYGTYNKNPVDDPTGAKSGKVHMIRGSHWSNVPCDCRCSGRRWMFSESCNDITGFRVVCEKKANASPKEEKKKVEELKEKS